MCTPQVTTKGVKSSEMFSHGSWQIRKQKRGYAKGAKRKEGQFTLSCVLPGDVENDDSGSNAVFMEQGSSASQMMAEKVLDVMARQPGCAGQASDGVSAATQVKMKDALELLKLPKSECPDIWVRLPRYKWPNSWSNMEDPVVPFERNFCGHPLGGLLWARKFERILMELGWEEVPN